MPLTGGGEGPGDSKAHGALVALDTDTGQQLWIASTLAEPQQVVDHDDKGEPIYGPNGAPVWSAPTIDAKTNRVYVGTGDGHSDPAGSTSDSILAYDMKTGAMVWAHQATAHDAYNGGCDRPDLKGCPREAGPDFDFGEAPALVTLANGKRLLVIGQKSGIAYGFDPDDKGRESGAPASALAGSTVALTGASRPMRTMCTWRSQTISIFCVAISRSIRTAGASQPYDYRMGSSCGGPTSRPATSTRVVINCKIR